jgi:hypothetical protein
VCVCVSGGPEVSGEGRNAGGGKEWGTSQDTGEGAV